MAELRIRGKNSRGLDSRQIKGLGGCDTGHTDVPAGLIHRSKGHIFFARCCQVAVNLIRNYGNAII